MTGMETTAPPAAPPPPPDPDAIARHLVDGGTFAGAVGIGEASLEALYSVAYNQYQQARYDEALTTFRILCLSDHRQGRHWLGLGATQQRLADYDGAVLAYSMAAEAAGSTNPEAPLRAAECYLALGLVDEALSGLAQAAAWAGPAADPGRVERQVEMLAGAVRRALKGVDARDSAS
jgi:type III secretion system low calcium response chaperone LcrH/SycD